MIAKTKQDGIGAAQRVPVPVVATTGHDQPGNAERARGLGAMYNWHKPPTESQPLAAIGEVVETLT